MRRTVPTALLVYLERADFSSCQNLSRFLMGPSRPDASRKSGRKRKAVYTEPCANHGFHTVYWIFYIKSISSDSIVDTDLAAGIRTSCLPFSSLVFHSEHFLVRNWMGSCKFSSFCLCCSNNLREVKFLLDLIQQPVYTVRGAWYLL